MTGRGKRLIRLESDWGISPFLIDLQEGEGTELLWLDIVQELFDLPDAVMDAVKEWNKLYDDHLDWDYPPATRWPSEEAARRYVERGRDVCRLLRRHVPDDVVIEYCADGYLITPEYY
jgi:hypothetical protein